MGMKFTEVLCFSFVILLGASADVDVPSQLGGIRFDKDLRAMTAFLSSQTTFGDIREKFQRLQQISTLLNLDEVRDFFLGEGSLI